jgi:hypothetical protein
LAQRDENVAGLALDETFLNQLTATFGNGHRFAVVARACKLGPGRGQFRIDLLVLGHDLNVGVAMLVSFREPRRSARREDRSGKAQGVGVHYVCAKEAFTNPSIVAHHRDH